MDIERARQHRQEIAQIAKLSSNRSERRAFLEEERSNPIYQVAMSAIIAARTKVPSFSSRKIILNEEQLARPLTEDEKIALWANNKADEYDNLPRGNTAERKKVSLLIRNVALELIQNPQKIIPAGTVWKTRHEEEKNKPEQKGPSFFESVKTECAKIAKEKWTSITPAQLVGLIKSYTYGQLARDLAGSAIEAFFKGPGSANEAARAFYNFTDATLDLVGDPKALEEAVKIGLFDSPLLQRGSRFWNKVNIARATICDDTLLQTAYVADNIMAELANLTTLNRKDIILRNQAYMMEVTKFEPGCEQETKSIVRKSLKQYGKEETIYRSEILGIIQTTLGPVHEDADHPSPLRDSWPVKLLRDPEEPLRKKFNALAGPRIAAAYVHKEIIEAFQRAEGTSPVIITMILPDNNILNVYVSNSFDLQKKAALIKCVVNSLSSTEKDLTRVAADSATFSTGYFDSLPYMFTYRRTTTPELSRHPIVALGEIGFPVPSLPEDEDIKSAINRLSQPLFAKSRYLNQRGYNVPFVDQAFRDLGYRGVTFFQDRENLHTSRAEIETNGLVYSVRFDRFFNLNLEGRSVDNQVLEQNLHYSLLFLLNKLLCDQKSQSKEQSERETDTGESPDQLLVKTRIGHLRWLPVSQHFRNRAVIACATETGDDLRDIQIIRWAANPEKADRETTYVSPVWKIDEAVEPIVVNISHIEGFS